MARIALIHMQSIVDELSHIRSVEMLELCVCSERKTGATICREERCRSEGSG